MDTLNYVLEAGRVQRYHTWPSNGRSQSIAEHVHRLYHVVGFLCDYAMSANLSLALMFHDLEEAYTGDMPYHVKRENPNIKSWCAEVEQNMLSAARVGHLQITNKEKQLIKWADICEAALYGLEQMHDRRYEQVVKNCLDLLHELDPPNDKCAELHFNIIGIYREKSND